MTDPAADLYRAYIALLASLTYQGKAVRVYSGMADDTAQAPYIILGPWAGSRDNTKTGFGWSGEINIDIVTRFVGNAHSTLPANDIAGLVLNRLKPTVDSTLAVTGWNCWETTVLDTNELLFNSPVDRVYRKIITVKHSLCPL